MAFLSTGDFDYLVQNIGAISSAFAREEMQYVNNLRHAHTTSVKINSNLVDLWTWTPEAEKNKCLSKHQSS